jgi:hypothetical protein
MKPLLFVLICTSLAVAQAPVKAPTVSDKKEAKFDTEFLSKQFTKLMLKNLPDPLIEAPDGWGNQKEVPIGIEWERRGAIRFRPKAMKDVKNDGHWKKVTLTADKPEDSLTVKIKDVQADGNKTVFDVYIGLDVKILYEQQMWAFGKRMYAGETRAKCHADLTLTVELTDKLEYKPMASLPDYILKPSVTKADLTYRDLEVEKTLGLGGDAAKVLGKGFLEILKVVKPNMDKDMLEKANKAIVKAAENKEIRIELETLLKAKKPEKPKK